jgi:hypothetical protein
MTAIPYTLINGEKCFENTPEKEENVLKNAVFWDVTPCGCYKNRCFGGTYRLHPEGEKK